ncbi:MAG: ISAs1 family transposase, partial [Anaerolineae bacterium]|nr:ISAs1 family transposase [Anaerolineae bacterium]
LDRFLRMRGVVNRSIVIAMDGKTLRGTVPLGQTQGVHLLAAFVPHERLVLMQVAVDGKENEITAAPQLLGCLDLGGKVVVADAMHCQRELSIQIVAAGGHYVWLTKDNQPRTRQAIADLFELPRCVLAHEQATAFRSATTTDKDHGRLEERTLVASDWLNGYLDWPHLGQVFRIERQFTYLKEGSIHSEVVYGLTDLRPENANPDQLLSYVRDYWGIENRLHYPRDKTLHEDGTRMTYPNQAQAMAAINNFIIALIAHVGWSNLPKARRFYDGNVDIALDLILRIPGPT